MCPKRFQKLVPQDYPSPPSLKVESWIRRSQWLTSGQGNCNASQGVVCSIFMMFLNGRWIMTRENHGKRCNFLYRWVDNLVMVAFDHEHTKDPSHPQRSHNHLGSPVAWISSKGWASIFTESMFDVGKMILYFTMHSAGLDDRHGLRQSYAEHSPGTTSMSCRKIEE